MLDESSYLTWNAIEIAELVNTRQASAVEVAQVAFTRLDAVEPELRAFRWLWPLEALSQARSVDRRVAAGENLPLAGVPLGIKASEAPDSVQRKRLLASGCVPIGVTTTPTPGTEWQTWGFTERGPTENPWMPGCSPGGSSAGSAAAVAARIVPLATGIDGAGSIRIPAGWCGVLGLKITNGILPTRDRSRLAAPGPICRSANDASRYLDAILGSPAKLPYRSHHGELDQSVVRAVWSPDLGYASVDSEQQAMARAAFEDMVSAGILDEHEAAAHLADPQRAWLALRSLDGDNTCARKVQRDNNHRLEELFERADVLVTPTTPGPPHEHSGPGNRINSALTWAFNLSGHPALSLPAGLDTGGCPVGLQLIARRGQEKLLLAITVRYQHITASLPTPPLFGGLSKAGQNAQGVCGFDSI